jgi:hypothetical protein
MQMLVDRILTANLVASTVVFYAAARTYVLPNLGRWSFSSIMPPILDLVVAIALANVYGAPRYMGAAYWIPAFWVPALLVTHYLTFLVLFGDRGDRA